MDRSFTHWIVCSSFSLCNSRGGRYRQFHQAHAHGPKLTSSLCLFIVWLVAPTTNAVKVIVMSNEVGLRWLCCGMCFPYIYLFVATRHDIKTDQYSKRLRLINMNMYCTFENQNEVRVFLYHCISERRLSLENVRCHFHFILHVIYKRL